MCFDQEKLFLSEKSVVRELEELDEQIAAEPAVNHDTLPELGVKDMNSSMLTLEIKVRTISRNL